MSAPTDSPAMQYLESVLQLDPHEHPLDIHRLRSEFLGFAEESSSTSGPRLSHAQAEQELQEIAEAWWNTPDQSLESELEAIDLESFPDLDEWRQRMRQIEGLRQHLAQARQASKVNPGVLDAVKQMTLTPPSRKAGVRVALIHSLKRTKRTGRTVRWLERNHPDLYAADTPLMTGLERERKGIGQQRRRRFWKTLIVVSFTIFMVAHVIHKVRMAS